MHQHQVQPHMERIKTFRSFSKLLSRASKAMPVIIDNNSTQLALDSLKSGSVVALPTDTIYGLACDATNSAAIEELYSIKCRNELKPLAICLGNVHDVKQWANVDHLPRGLLSLLLPGPVTLLLNGATDQKQPLDKSLLSREGLVGIRIPDYGFIRSIANGLKKPLALTSANGSGEPSCLRVCEFQGLWAKVAQVFDGGDLSRNGLSRCGSTIVDLSKRGLYFIVRDGSARDKTVRTLHDFGLKPS